MYLLARIVTATSKMLLEAVRSWNWLKDFHELCPPDGAETRVQSRAWNAILKFFNRPYWQRMWTFQETVVARELVIMCGDERMHSSDIIVVSSIFDTLFFQVRPPSFARFLWWNIRSIKWSPVISIAVERDNSTSFLDSWQLLRYMD
jgi:hypothetical protein